ncbi:hypothetical protein ISN45_Aa05g001620 [Arabidopsis thaliana x Arabidopsis arenosa]|uniref:Transmembrane protein n=1 Tax=Arabidopsis thaliana x Arabidopsis arenosa TaxID=1240361 RepID=A0A8T1ZJU5_9BRAS|nr:hypothetical protein ISN45_Aa05g001620 [Arabidopsis thaliana x Arabidopsis arenosa]
MDDEPIPFRRLVAFHATKLYYSAAVSMLFTFFILPELCSFVSNIFWDVFVEKRLWVLALLLYVVAVMRYLFRNNEEYMEELAYQPLPPVYQPEDLTHKTNTKPAAAAAVVTASTTVKRITTCGNVCRWRRRNERPQHTIRSAFLAFFILPEFGVIVSDLLWKIFVEKQFRVVVFVLCVVAVFRYLFRRNDEEIEIPDLKFTPVFRPADLQFPLPDLPPSDPPYPVHSSIYSSSVGANPPPSSSPPFSFPSPGSFYFSSAYSDLPPSDPPYLVHSSFYSSSVGTTLPPSSPAFSFPSPGSSFSSAYSDLPSDPMYPVHSSFYSSSVGTTTPPLSPLPFSFPSPGSCSFSSAYSDLPSDFPSPLSTSDGPFSPRSPPPPPFKMKPWKVFMHGDYAWIGSDVSLSSDESDRAAVDAKSDRLIRQFKRQLRSEKRRTRMAKND